MPFDRTCFYMAVMLPSVNVDFFSSGIPHLAYVWIVNLETRQRDHGRWNVEDEKH